MARMAPIAPRTTAQSSTEKKVSVWLRATALPTTFGCTTDWTTALTIP